MTAFLAHSPGDIDYVLIMHLDSLGHADGHVEDVHGDLGRMRHSRIREEWHGLLAAKLYYMATASAVCLSSAKSNLLNRSPPGLICADCKFGASQSAGHLEGGHSGRCSCQILWCRRNCLRNSYRLKQVFDGIAYSLSEVHELHGDLSGLLSEIVRKERAYAASTCIYFYLNVTLDL